jgi:hypothetical protein
MIPYLALYLLIVLKYGGLSRGASGLTMTLTGYAVPVLLVILVKHIECFKFDVRRAAVVLGTLFVLAILTMDAWVTIQRFAGLRPGPDGVAVLVHVTGLVLGVLWCPSHCLDYSSLTVPGHKLQYLPRLGECLRYYCRVSTGTVRTPVSLDGFDRDHIRNHTFSNTPRREPNQGVRLART